MSENKKFGYVRVSSKDQNPDRQITAMKEQGIDERDIKIDKVSGKDFNREAYKALKNHSLREGDTLFIKELDRLGRNSDQIKQEWKELTDMGVNIVVLDMDILDTRQYKNGTEKLITNIVLELLSYMAQKEREKINKRQKEGIEQAKKKGVNFGRPEKDMPDNFPEIYKKVYIDNEMTAVKAIEQLDVSKGTFYKMKKQYEKENNIDKHTKYNYSA